MNLICDTLSSDVSIVSLEFVENHKYLDLNNGLKTIFYFLKGPAYALLKIIKMLWHFVLAINKGITTLIIVQLMLIYAYIKYMIVVEKIKLFIIPKPVPNQDPNIIDSAIFFTKITAYIIFYQQIKLYNYYFSKNFLSLSHETALIETLWNYFSILKSWLVYFISGVPARLQKIIKALMADAIYGGPSYNLINPNKMLTGLNKNLVNYISNWNIVYAERHYQINPSNTKRLARKFPQLEGWMRSNHHNSKNYKIYYSVANHKKLNELETKRENLIESIEKNKYPKIINDFLKKNFITESGLRFNYNPINYRNYLACRSSILGYETYDTAASRLINGSWAQNQEKMKIFDMRKLNEMEDIYRDIGRLFSKKLIFHASDIRKNLGGPSFRGTHPMSPNIVEYADGLGGGTGALLLTHKQSASLISNLGDRMGEITTLAYPRHSWAKNISITSPRPAAMIIPEESIIGKSGGSGGSNITEPFKKFEEVNFTEGDLLYSALDYQIKLSGSTRFISGNRDLIDNGVVLTPSWKFTDSNLQDAYTEFWEKTKSIVGCDEFVQTDYNDLISFAMTNKAQGNHDIFKAYREDILDAINHIDQSDLD